MDVVMKIMTEKKKNVSITDLAYDYSDFNDESIISMAVQSVSSMLSLFGVYDRLYHWSYSPEIENQPSEIKL